MQGPYLASWAELHLHVSPFDGEEVGLLDLLMFVGGRDVEVREGDGDHFVNERQRHDCLGFPGSVAFLNAFLYQVEERTFPGTCSWACAEHEIHSF